MNWHDYIEEKPTFNQDIYFIRQYMQGRQTVCEGSFGIMKKDGIHPYVTDRAYSTYPCDDRDITVWVDQAEYMVAGHKDLVYVYEDDDLVGIICPVNPEGV